jgi:IstB-like ATP binding protein
VAGLAGHRTHSASVNRPAWSSRPDVVEPQCSLVPVVAAVELAAAMLDRLLHRSVVINLDGESYRLRDHHAAAETLRQAATGTRQPIH